MNDAPLACLECGQTVWPNDEMVMFTIARGEGPDADVQGGVTHKGCEEPFRAKLTAAYGPSEPIPDDELKCPQCDNPVIPGKQWDKDAQGRTRERNRCINCDTPLARDPDAVDNRWRVEREG